MLKNGRSKKKILVATQNTKPFIHGRRLRDRKGRRSGKKRAFAKFKDFA